MQPSLALDPAILRQASDAASPLRQEAAQRLLTPRDIRGPAIVYITYAGCSVDSGHDFRNIEAVARRAGVPVYAITLNPATDVLGGNLAYLARDGGGKIVSHRAPGIHIFPHDNAEAIRVANSFGLSVNRSSIAAHSNRLVYIDADEKPVASIPSTQPLARIMDTLSRAFGQPDRNRGARLG